MARMASTARETYFTDLEPYCEQAKALYPFPFRAFETATMSANVRRKAFRGLARFIVDEWTLVRPEASLLSGRRKARLAFLAMISASDLESMSDEELVFLLDSCTGRRHSQLRRPIRAEAPLRRAL